eukprot:6545880-Prymnesium_polylepis.1
MWWPRVRLHAARLSGGCALYGRSVSSAAVRASCAAVGSWPCRRIAAISSRASTGRLSVKAIRSIKP